jgi:hypothetical protein
MRPLSIFRILVCAAVCWEISTCASDGAVVESTWVGQAAGNWFDSANWSPSTVPNNTLDNTYNVTLPMFSLTADIGSPAVIDRLAMNGGILRGDGFVHIGTVRGGRWDSVH